MSYSVLSSRGRSAWWRLALALSLGAMSFGLMGIGCCDCAKRHASIFYLRFNVDSLSGQGFRQQELRSAYLLAYNAPDLSGLPDTLRQPPSQGPVHYGQVFDLTRDGAFSIDLDIPLRSGIVAHSYQVLVPAAQRQFTVTDFAIDVEGGGGPCHCTFTKSMDLSVDGQRIDALRNAVILNR